MADDQDPVQLKLMDLDGDDIAAGSAREMLRLVEMRDEAMFRAALGMDQRAAAIAAGLAAAAGALAAAAFATTGTWRVVALAIAVDWTVAAGLAAYVTRPQKSRFPGTAAQFWADNVHMLAEDAAAMLPVSLTAMLQRSLRENEAKQARNGRWLLGALYVAAAGPLVGAAAAISLWALGCSG